MYLGRFQLGTSIPLYLQCVDSAGTRALPDNPPQVKVRSTSSLVLTAEMPIHKRYLITGLFLYPLFLGSSYTTGHYNVVYTYRVSSFYGIAEDTFEVVAGGNIDGQVMNMYFFHKPHADFVVYGTERGVIAQGRNPSV